MTTFPTKISFGFRYFLYAARKNGTQQLKTMRNDLYFVELHKSVCCLFVCSTVYCHLVTRWKPCMSKVQEMEKRACIQSDPV